MAWRLAAAGSVGLALLAPVTSGRAAEWYVNSHARQEVSYDDNIGLRASDDEQIAAFGETSSVGLNVGGKSPTLGVRLDSLFNFTRFPDESRLNSNDQYLTLGSSYTGERLSAELTGQYIRDTTRTSDIEDSGLFILQNRRREVYRLLPRLSYKLTPADDVSVDVEFSDTTYPSGDIRSFQRRGGSGTWTHSLTERTQILASFLGFQVNSNDAGSQNTTYYAAQVGAAHLFSPNLKARLLAGPTLAHVDFVAVSGGLRFSNSDTTLGYGFDGTVDYHYQDRLSFQGRIYRTVRPSSTSGIVLEETGFRVSARYAILQHLFFDASALYLLREDVGQGRSSQRRDFVTVEPALRWRLAEDWDARLAYRYRWQRFGEADEDPHASSNAVLASITYRLPPLSMSR